MTNAIKFTSEGEIKLAYKVSNDEIRVSVSDTGMGISEELGGYVTITVAVIIITGIIGNVLAETICRVFKIEEPVAKGIAIGSSSHALGTAKALELGEIEGAMSSLSIAVAGILTVIAAPIFATLL